MSSEDQDLIPDPAIQEVVTRFIESLGERKPRFMCPVPGGGLQLEWDDSKKHLEIEFLSPSQVVYLQEELYSEGVVSGECSLHETEVISRIIGWFYST